MVSRKILITGQSGAGKTSIVKRFVYGKFDEEYFHSAVERIDSKQLKVNSTRLDLSIYDSVNSNSKSDSSFIDASGIIYVIDAGKPIDCSGLQDQLKLFRQRMPYVPVFIAFNKSDISDMQTKSFVNEFISDDCIFSTSAKSGEQLDFLFQRMGEEILKRYKRNLSFLNFF